MQTIRDFLGFSDGYVDASDSGKAYQGFSEGKVLLTEDPAILEKFFEDNKSEFYGSMIVRDDDGFKRIPNTDPAVYFTFHKYAMPESVMQTFTDWEGIRNQALQKRNS